MNKICLSVTALLLTAALHGQHTLQVKVLDAVSKKPLSYASVSLKGAPHGVTADSTGLAQLKISSGKNTINVSYIGYENQVVEVVLPLDPIMVVELTPSEEEDEEVVIQSTRSTRTIRDIPTRVEFVAGEELDEKANMKPGDIRMVLNESTGITTQQTSATSANASIRIQGLDGRYTQILKDGLPVYAGFSGGLGLLQTPPLDLKQFEVIKGSSSTLYGGGAIAGLVNLISKAPKEERELNFHIDVTSAGGINTSGFYGEKFKKVGVTVFASRNSNSAYDPSTVGLTAIPEFERYTINPKLFFYIKEKTQLMIGGNITTEKRTGGDIEYIDGNKPSGYSERNNTDRYSSQLLLDHHFNDKSQLTFKNSINRFERVIDVTGYVFNGSQTGTFSEATYSYHGDRSEWTGGINFVTDHFEEIKLTATPSRNYEQITTGLFIQNSLKVSDKFSMEAGLRSDYVKDYGFTVLPRLSMLFKFAPKLSSRIGGGMGYKTPNIFTEESERLLYENVLPIDPDENKMERSYGVNADINYRTKFADDKMSFSINHLFFYTRIHDPLLLEALPGVPIYRFKNVEGHFDSRGMETNVKLGYGNFKLFIGYTYTKAYLHEGEIKTENYLTPRHRLNNVLLYEVEEKWKIGLEAYYFSKQQLSDGATGKSYWITGLMAEKLYGKFSLYINFENFTDTRQTRFDTIYTGTIDNPKFRNIYAPLDGFVMNGGIKLHL
jgi:outer membrane cobalamin receptor